MKYCLILLTLLLTIIPPILFASGNSLDGWRVRNDQVETENYYLGDKEKRERMDNVWNNYAINRGAAEVAFPWEPDIYAIPGPAVGDMRNECSTNISMAERDDKLVFAITTMRCNGTVISDNAIKHRLNGALEWIVKRDRKLLYKKNLKIVGGYAMEVLVSHPSGNISRARLFSIRESVYMIDVTAAGDEINSYYTTKFLESFNVLLPKQD